MHETAGKLMRIRIMMMVMIPMVSLTKPILFHNVNDDDDDNDGSLHADDGGNECVDKAETLSWIMRGS